MTATPFFTRNYDRQLATARDNALLALRGLADVVQRLAQGQEVAITRAEDSTGSFDDIDAYGWAIHHLDGDISLDFYDGDDGVNSFDVYDLLTPAGRALLDKATPVGNE